jgi:hypothetical protein
MSNGGSDEDHKKSPRHLSIVILGGLSVGGCATTGYVDEKIAAVNARIAWTRRRGSSRMPTPLRPQFRGAGGQFHGASQWPADRPADWPVDALEQRMASKSPRN